MQISNVLDLINSDYIPNTSEYFDPIPIMEEVALWIMGGFWISFVMGFVALWFFWKLIVNIIKK